MKFEDLEIIEPILKALKEEKYSVPTSIQEKAIPLIINRNDVLGSAQTGTGKTAAFAIPILQHLFLNRQRNNSPLKINALIIRKVNKYALIRDYPYLKLYSASLPSVIRSIDAQFGRF